MNAYEQGLPNWTMAWLPQESLDESPLSPSDTGPIVFEALVMMDEPLLIHSAPPTPPPPPP